MFGIGEIARRAGVAPSTIRFYERIGLLPPSKRVSGKRRYDDAVLQKLALIRLAQQAGFTIAEIQRLLHQFPAETPPPERWQTLAGGKIAELDELIGRLQAMRALLERTQQCCCSTLEECGVEMLANDNANPISGCS
jgi:MerR family transcriptional regulator, redox-sensitive transcriptional activator SoxR